MSTCIDPQLTDFSVQDICPRNKWVSGSQRRNCFSCKMAFSLTKRRHHCRVCGEVVCSACTQKFKLDTARRQFFSTRMRICMVCICVKRKLSETPPITKGDINAINTSHGSNAQQEPAHDRSLLPQPTMGYARDGNALFVWMTAWVGFAVFVTTFYDVFKWHYKLVVIISFYLLYLVAFIIFLNRRSKSAQKTGIRLYSSSLTGSLDESRPSSMTFIPVSEGYPEYVARLVSALQYYTTPNSAWRLSINRGNVFYYRMAISKAAPAHKVIAFIPSLKIADFLRIVDTRSKRVRQRWDENMKEYKEIEDHGNFSIFYNAQNCFFGGVIAPRDFCLMSYRTESAYCVSSIDHEAVPVRKGHIRGNIHFSGMKCEDSILDGQCGFWITYIVHADIKGSLPTTVVANGTMDMMIKFISLFQAENDSLIEKSIS